MAKEVIKLGMYVGLGGAVTFKNAKTPVAVAASIPLESMVLETDAPLYDSGSVPWKTL